MWVHAYLTAPAPAHAHLLLRVRTPTVGAHFAARAANLRRHLSTGIAKHSSQLRTASAHKLICHYCHANPTLRSQTFKTTSRTQSYQELHVAVASSTTRTKTVSIKRENDLLCFCLLALLYALSRNYGVYILLLSTNCIEIEGSHLEEKNKKKDLDCFDCLVDCLCDFCMHC